MVAGVALTFLTNTFNPNIASLVAVWTAYVSITPGKTGNLARVFGDAAWDTSKTILRTLKNVAFELGVKLPFIREERRSPFNIEQPLLTGKEEVQLDDDIVSLVKEVEETVAEVESVLTNSNEVKNTIAREELLADEADRLAEEARTLEIEYLLEEARIEKEAYQAEEEFRAVEAQIAEEERLEKEAELALLEEEQRIAAEEAELAEKERLAEEARIAEEERVIKIKEAEEAEKQRLAEEERAAEEARLAEEAKKQRLAEEERVAEEARVAQEQKLAEEAEKLRLAEEERAAEEAQIASEQTLAEEDVDENSFIDEMEWETSIQLADEISQNEESKSEWNAARQLANDLTDDDDSKLLDYESPDLTDDERQELLAQALRAAVEKSELQRREEEEMAEREKEKRNSMKRELQYADILETPSDEEEVIAVDEGEEDKKTREDYQKMTVKNLKEILRSRGLKVSGRKAELIERLISE